MTEAKAQRNKVATWSPTLDALPLFVGAHLDWQDAYATVTLSQCCWRNGVWDGRELVLTFSHAPIVQVFYDGAGPEVVLGAFVIEDSDWVAAVPEWRWLERPAHYRLVTSQATVDVGASFPPELAWREQPVPAEPHA